MTSSGSRRGVGKPGCPYPSRRTICGTPKRPRASRNCSRALATSMGWDSIEAARPLVSKLGCGIVFITAHADVPTRVMIRSFVPTAEVLSKPVEWSEIEAACARVKPNGDAV